MNDSKQYRVLSIFANLVSGYGWLIVLFWFVIGTGISWTLMSGMMALLIGLLTGIVIGIPIIAFGQLLAVWLDQRNYLRDIAQSLTMRQ